MPVTISIIHRRMVTMRVTMTSTLSFPRFISPSIFSSMVFCVKGKIFFRSSQAITIMMMTSGTMKSIHWPKPMPRFRPSGSFRYLRAMVLGGVPMGVPMPPRLAAMGMLRAMAVRPLPASGSCLNTGVRKVSIMAVVAVLLMNMEKRAVTSMKPRRMFSLFLPKGVSRTRARCTSRPVLVVAMARMKPPMKSITTGSAKLAMTCL